MDREEIKTTKTDHVDLQVDVMIAGIPVKGHVKGTVIHTDPSTVKQEALMPEIAAKVEEKPHRVITDKMIGFLRVRGRWDEKLSFDEAHTLIGDITKKENEE